MVDILYTVKILLNIEDNTQDILLDLYIEMAKQSVLTYCNLKKVPPELNFTIARMVVDTYREGMSNMDNMPVTSVSEAGRTISFATTAILEKSMADKVNKIQELNRFRRLYK